MIILGYCRESTLDQYLHGYNIAEQQRVIENYCAREFMNYDLEMFVEKGKSATTLNRPELRNLLAKAKSIKAACIVFHSIDRLTRNIGDLYELMGFFKSNGIDVRSVMEFIDMDTAIGRNHIYTSGLYAMLESERTSERTIRAFKQAAIEGKFCSPRIPIGYEKVDKRLVISSKQRDVDIVKFVFNSVADGEYSYKEIVNKLFIDYNYKLNAETIPKIISNKIYIGTRVYKEIVNEQFCEPIIDIDLFNRANKNKNQIIRQNSKRVEYLFKNKVFENGSDTHAKHSVGTSKTGTTYMYYVVNGKYYPEKKIIEYGYEQLSDLCTRWQMDKKGINDSKDKLAKLMKRQSDLVASQKNMPIDYDTFYELYIDISEQILQTTNKINQWSEAHFPFNSLSKTVKSDVIKRYVKKVIVTPKSKNKEFSVHFELKN